METRPLLDHYSVLGVDATAGEAEMNVAWRQLARSWEPGGPEAATRLQQIVTAYAVLSDTVERAAYDRRRRGGVTEEAAAPAHAWAGQPRGTLLWRLSGPLHTLIGSGAARRGEDDVIELLVQASEAAEGGIATISLRVPVACPDCASNVEEPCERCGSQRSVEELFSAWITLPPGVAEGAILRPSVLLPGMARAVSFRVRRADRA